MSTFIFPLTIFLPLDFIPSGETVVFGSLASISCITSGANQMSTLISPHILVSFFLSFFFFFLEGRKEAFSKFLHPLFSFSFTFWNEMGFKRGK